METPVTEKRKISNIILAAVASNRLSAIGYNEIERVCAIQFPDAKDGTLKVYQYPMEPDTFEQFKAAESKGKFFGAVILANVATFPHTRLTSEEIAEHIILPTPPAETSQADDPGFAQERQAA